MPHPLSCWPRIIAALMILIISYSLSELSFSATEHPSAPQTISRLVRGQNTLGCSLFQYLYQQAGRENIVISPISIGRALQMAYYGTAGDTQRAMSQVLHLPSGQSNQTIADHASLALDRTLQGLNPDVQIAIANALWMNKDISLKLSFLARNKRYAQAQIFKLDSHLSSAAQKINQWVKRHTYGKINSIVDTIQTNITLLLLNAVYFKGQWSQPFSKTSTIPHTFYRRDGSTQQTPMMRQSGKFSYLETTDFQAIRLPYGKTRRIAMLIFLPKLDLSKAGHEVRDPDTEHSVDKKTNTQHCTDHPTTSSQKLTTCVNSDRLKAALNSFINQLNPERLSAWLSQSTMRWGAVQLPRFTTLYRADLKKALTQLGMGIAFDPKTANFSAITNDRLYMDGVLHKAFIEVDEAGTEAAATTATLMVGTSAATPTAPFSFIADHPFFYAIIDEKSQAILFIGAMNQPLKTCERYPINLA